MDVPTPNLKRKKQWNLKYATFGLAGALVLGALILLPKYLGDALPSVGASDLWISEVARGDFVKQVRGVGTLIPVTDRWVTAEASGLIEKVYVKPGVTVDENTVLVELKNPTLEKELLQSQSDLKVAVSRLSALEAKLANDELQYEFDIAEAKLSYESAQTILKAHEESLARNLIPRLDFVRQLQEAKTAAKMLEMVQKRQPFLIESIKAQLQSEKAIVEQLQHKVDGVRQQVESLKVKSGISGVLQELVVNEGERAEIGLNIARVAKPLPLMAQLEVQEVRAKDLVIGLDVEIDTRNGKTSGKIIRIDPRVTDGSVSIDVSIDSELPTGARPDQSVTGIIQVQRVADAISIDRPSSVSAQSRVLLFVLDDNGAEAMQREVTLGSASISRVEVLSGLVAGEKVIVSDTSDFKQHQRVKIN